MARSKIQMTRHALMRLEERTRLSVEILEAIFDGGFVVKVGTCRQPGRHNLVHRMFFSPIDHSFFVAIQNILDGAVLTVLTFEQYRNHYAGTSVGARAIREEIGRATGR